MQVQLQPTGCTPVADLRNTVMQSLYGNINLTDTDIIIDLFHWHRCDNVFMTVKQFSNILSVGDKR